MSIWTTKLEQSVPRVIDQVMQIRSEADVEIVPHRLPSCDVVLIAGGPDRRRQRRPGRGHLAGHRPVGPPAGEAGGGTLSLSPPPL
jgi:hypothetical protein